MALTASTLQGCTKQPRDTLTNGQWISAIVRIAEIPDAEETTPYFLNVAQSSVYYADVQAAVEWQILEQSHAFDPDAELTKDFCAYTLVNLAGFQADSEERSIKDIGRSAYPKHLSSAYTLGLMQADKDMKLHPEARLERSEAMDYLNTIVQYINDRNPKESEPIIAFRSSIKEADVLNYDAQTQTVLLKPGAYEENDVIHFQNAEGEYYLTITELTKSGDGIIARTEQPSTEALFDDLHVSNSFDVDFSQAEFIDETGMEFNESSYVQPSGIRLMAAQPLSKSKEVFGYTVSYKATASGLKASVTKKVSTNSKVVAEINLNHLRPSYQWDMEDGKLNTAYFKVNFDTEESLYFTSGSYKTVYGDFSNFNSADFLSNIQTFLKPKSEIPEVTVPLCMVRIPLPEAPMMTITVTLQLRIYATGRAELSFSQSHALGMEIRGGKVRSINDHKQDCTASIKADTGLTGNLRFGFDLTNVKLADIRCESGVKAKFQSVLHLYDEKNRHTAIRVDYEADALDDLASVNGNAAVCGDLSAHWTSSVVLNSSSTLAGKLGLSKTFDLFDESEGLVFPIAKTHVENGFPVATCTRLEREEVTQDLEEIASDHIGLRDYGKILTTGSSTVIEIASLPKGYGRSDLIFTSNDISVANVDRNGNVTGLTEGNAIITIQTYDGRYKAHCNILVHEETIV